LTQVTVVPALTVRVPGWNEKFSTMIWFGVEGLVMSLPAAGDGFAGISIFDISVFVFRDTVGAGGDVSELLPEPAPVWPHAVNKLSKPVTVMSNNFLFK
jgi:hypothetical protein